MTETLRTQAYEDRASSQLGVGDYLKKHVFSVMLPFVGVAVGFGLGKAFKGSWFDANYYNSGMIKSIFGKDAKTMAVLNEAAAQNPHMQNGIIWGLKAGGVWGIYNLWKDRNKSQMGINDVQQEVMKLKEYESSNDFLTRENEHLRQQISFTDKHVSKAHTGSHAEQVRESQAATEAETAR